MADEQQLIPATLHFQFECEKDSQRSKFDTAKQPAANFHQSQMLSYLIINNDFCAIFIKYDNF
jgi:hypothetical protein